MPTARSPSACRPTWSRVDSPTAIPTTIADANHAEAKALDACRTTKDAANDVKLRSLCKVIQDYSNQCVAVAMDPAAGTPGVGWAVANDLLSAERQALGKCMDTAGPGRRAACVVDHSSCDGNAK